MYGNVLNLENIGGFGKNFTPTDSFLDLNFLKKKCVVYEELSNMWPNIKQFDNPEIVTFGPYQSANML